MKLALTYPEAVELLRSQYHLMSTDNVEITDIPQQSNETNERTLSMANYRIGELEMSLQEKKETNDKILDDFQGVARDNMRLEDELALTKSQLAAVNLTISGMETRNDYLLGQTDAQTKMIAVLNENLDQISERNSELTTQLNNKVDAIKM